MNESILLSLWHVCLFYRWARSFVAISHSDPVDFPDQSLHLTSGFIPSSSINQRTISLQNKVGGLKVSMEYREIALNSN